jgi:hypothetical protein
MFLRNVGSHTDYTVLYLRRWQHSVVSQVGAGWIATSPTNLQVSYTYEYTAEKYEYLQATLTVED